MSRPSSTWVADIGYVDLTTIGAPNAQGVMGASTNNGVNSVIDIDYGGTQHIACALSSIGQ